MCSQRGHLKSVVEHVFEKYKQKKKSSLQLITVKMDLEEKPLIF